MRDEETSEIGLRAAMTGHMVLSTLHTNDAISTVNRLLDMGIKNYLLASALHAILAQRLVRRICRSCIQPEDLNGRQQAWVSSHGLSHAQNKVFHKGIGCPHCSYTGYSGRIGVYELLEFDQKLSDSLAHGDGTSFTRTARNVPGFVSLETVALQDAFNGITSVDEVLRISADVDAYTEQITGTEPEPALTAPAQ
jgi:MSHA biogenesis protein MshE